MNVSKMQLLSVGLIDEVIRAPPLLAEATWVRMVLVSGFLKMKMSSINVINVIGHTPALLWAWALLMYRESSFILEPLRHSR